MTIRFDFKLTASLLVLSLASMVQAQPLSAPAPAAAPVPTAAPAPPPPQQEDDIAGMTSVPDLLRMGSEAAERKDWSRYGQIMQRVLELRPYAGNIQVEIAASYAMRNDKTGGYNALMRLPDQGYGFDIADDERLENLHGTQVWDYLVEHFGDHRKSIGAGKVVATLPKEDLLVESVAWDPTRKAVLVGSVRTGKVYRVGGDGKLVDFVVPNAANGIGGVFDIAVDAARKVLWVASAQVPHAPKSDPERYGESAVLKFDLATGKLLRRVDIAADGAPHVPSSLAIAPDGSLFVADSVQPIIWKIEDSSIVKVAENPKLTGIRALVVNGRGDVLYLADHELGILGIDLAAGTAFQLTGPPSLTLYAVDALAWHDNKMIAVQNGFPPARVMRFALDEKGHQIVNTQILDAANAAFGIPGNGAVGDDGFYMIANSQKHLVDGQGKLMAPASLEGVRIFRSALKQPMPEPLPLPASLRGQPTPQGH